MSQLMLRHWNVNSVPQVIEALIMCPRRYDDLLNRRRNVMQRARRCGRTTGQRQ